jgi:hypothetical protein
MLLARQHGSPRKIRSGIGKTKPEQTLSVPFVFRNHLKFNEWVKGFEIISAPAILRCPGLLGIGTGKSGLVLLGFSACRPVSQSLSPGPQ